MNDEDPFARFEAITDDMVAAFGMLAQSAAAALRDMRSVAILAGYGDPFQPEHARKTQVYLNTRRRKKGRRR